MRNAKELLDDLYLTKRARCISEYDGWIDDVAEYLKDQVQQDCRISELESEVNYKEEFDALCARFVEAHERIKELESQMDYAAERFSDLSELEAVLRGEDDG